MIHHDMTFAEIVTAMLQHSRLYRNQDEGKLKRPPNVKAAAKGLQTQGSGRDRLRRFSNQEDNTEAFEAQAELDQLDSDIETALEHECSLARKAYRVRKLILDLQVKRDALEELGALLTERRAA